MIDITRDNRAILSDLNKVGSVSAVDGRETRRYDRLYQAYPFEAAGDLFTGPGFVAKESFTLKNSSCNFDSVPRVFVLDNRQIISKDPDIITLLDVSNEPSDIETLLLSPACFASKRPIRC